MVSVWYPPAYERLVVLEIFKCMGRCKDIYVWNAEFDEVHVLLILDRPFEDDRTQFPGAIFAEAIPTWQHGYRREQAERHPSVIHWNRNQMEVE